MKHPYKFKELERGDILILPKQYDNPITKLPFDFLSLRGDDVIFGLSTGFCFENMSGECKSLRELYEEQRTKK